MGDAVDEGAGGTVADDCWITTRGGGFVEENVITCAAAAAPVPTQSVTATATATVFRGSMPTTIGSAALRRRKVASKSGDLVLTSGFAEPQVTATLARGPPSTPRKTGTQRHRR